MMIFASLSDGCTLLYGSETTSSRGLVKLEFWIRIRRSSFCPPSFHVWLSCGSWKKETPCTSYSRRKPLFFHGQDVRWKKHLQGRIMIGHRWATLEIIPGQKESECLLNTTLNRMWDRMTTHVWFDCWLLNFEYRDMDK